MRSRRREAQQLAFQLACNFKYKTYSNFILERFEDLRISGQKSVSFDGTFLETLSIGDRFAALSLIISFMGGFTSLNLSLNGWNMTPKIFANFSVDFHNLRSLTLHDCNLGSEDCENLAIPLQLNCSITSLDLSHNVLIGLSVCRGEVSGIFDLSGFSSLLSALLKSNTLETLNLSGNNLGLKRQDSDKPKKIRNNKLRQTNENPSISEFTIKQQVEITAALIIKQFLFKNRSLKFLNINANKFDDDDEIALFLLSHNIHHTSGGNTTTSKKSKCNSSSNSSGGSKHNNFGLDNSEYKRNSSSCSSSSSSSSSSTDIQPGINMRRSSRVATSFSSSNSSSSRSYNNDHIPSTLISTSPLTGSPCQSLCGIRLENSNSTYCNLNFSILRPPIQDLANLSNRCLDSFTGRLLGEQCINQIFYYFDMIVIVIVNVSAIIVSITIILIIVIIIIIIIINIITTLIIIIIITDTVLYLLKILLSVLIFLLILSPLSYRSNITVIFFLIIITVLVTLQSYHMITITKCSSPTFYQHCYPMSSKSVEL